MDPREMLEVLLELAGRAELEVRVLGSSAAGQDLRPTSSAACRVGKRVWVVLAPDDPPRYQAQVLAAALGRFRGEFLEETFVAPAVRALIDSSEG